MKELVLVPKPNKISRLDSTYSVPASLGEELSRYTIGGQSPAGVTARINTQLIKEEQGYRLEVTPDAASVVAGGKEHQP